MALSMQQCLTEAADLIEANEWGQYALKRAFGRAKPEYCMIGACVEVCPKTDLAAFAVALGFTNTQVAFSYNDRKGQTKKHVLARLRKYAEAAAEEQP